jgi:murein DD-endopeptidase MepM/ murein hydrolase activator NlpD
MGSTGFSTGPHLHFEIHPQGQKAVNPLALLPKQ